MTAPRPARMPGAPARRPAPWLRPGGLALALLLGACAAEPEPMPVEAAVAEVVAENPRPVLYQQLYRMPLAPSTTAEQQRVRILIWVLHMEFSESQLSMLESLRAQVIERTEQIVQAEREVAQRFAPEEAEIYAALWERLQAGVPGDAPEMLALAERLDKLNANGEREQQLLKVRLEGIRAVLQAEDELLATLSPTQEALLVDALFFLRHHLDPVGNPEDFQALVGTTYDAGQYAVLARGTTQWARQPLNIGGLWSDETTLKGGALHDAKREKLLYLALLEPGMDEALAAARGMLARELDLELIPEEAPPVEPPPVEAAPVEAPPAEPPPP